MNQMTTAEILQGLQHPDPKKRLGTIRFLEKQTHMEAPIIRSLERLVLQDRDNRLRQAALHILGSAPSHQTYQLMTTLDPEIKQQLLNEINHWEDDGLLTPAQLDILRKRYALEPAWEPETEPQPEPVPVQAATIKSPAPAVPLTSQQPVKQSKPVSLLDILLNETFLKIAMYLGAFLIIVAAFVWGTLHQATRIPSLAIATLLFFGVALGLFRRLPLASIVFFVIGTFMVPILSGVIIPTYKLDGQQTRLIWSLTFLLVGLIAAGGTYLYKSGLFSILALLSVDISVGFLCSWLAANFHLFILLNGILALIAVLSARLLGRWQGNKLFLPLFILAQIQNIALLGISFITIMIGLISENITSLTWITISSFWMSAAITFIFSDWIVFFNPNNQKTNLPVFPLLAVVTLIPVPIYVSGCFKPEFWQVMLVSWVWGLVISISGEFLLSKVTKWLKRYGILLLAAGSLLFLVSLFSLWIDEHQITPVLFAASSILYTLMHIRQARWPVWSGALASFGFGVLATFSLTDLSEVKGLDGLVLLFLGLAYFITTLIPRQITKSRARWWLPPLVSAVLIAVINSIEALYLGSEHPGKAAFIFAVYTAIFILYAILERRPYLLYGALVLSPVALYYGQKAAGLSEQLPGHLILTGLWYLAAYILLRLRGSQNNWPPTLRYCGMILQNISLAWITSFASGSLAFSAYAVFSLIFALPENMPAALYLTTLISLPLAVSFVLLHLEAVNWALPAVVLTGIYYALHTLLTRQERTRAWAAPLLWSALAMQHLTLLTSWDSANTFWAFLAYGVFSWVFAVLRRQPLFGYAALIAFPIALYFGLETFNIPYRLPAYLLLTALWYLSAFIVQRIRRKQDPWLSVLLISGLVLQHVALIWIDAYSSGVLAFTAYAVFALIFALLEQKPLALYLATLIGLPAVLICALLELDLNSWAFPAIGLAGAYYGISIILDRWKKTQPWAAILLRSGFVLQHLMLLTAWDFGKGSLLFLAYAAYALLFALREKKPPFLYLATLVGLPAALVLGLLHLEWNSWVLPAITLTAIYYGVSIYLTRRGQARPWGEILLWNGLVLQHTTLLTGWNTADASLAFLAYAIFSLAYATQVRQPRYGYGTIVSLPVSLGLALLYFEADFWVLPYIGLALIYYLVGLLLTRLQPLSAWCRMLIISGLVLGFGVSCSVPFEGHIISGAGIALAAFMYTYEAFRTRNLWLGFPANFLYFLAYALLLLKLDVTQPQFFTVFAAVLGIVMHYLLLRRDFRRAALTTGILVQLVLFSTTLYQMIAAHQLQYFIVLLFQALVTLVYGGIIRSRSFVIGPIAFLVPGSIYAAFTFSGIPVVILTGCTGTLLLTLGVFSLVMRERLVNTLQSMGNWNP
ncbi:MAG: hypothetical protein JXA13_00060 [Anaerolineales bacterium]|nr:hypothetical protein [Anaerolineales bacterium]